MADPRDEPPLPDLSPRLHALAILTASIGRPDWARFGTGVRTARSLQVKREDLAEGLLQATLFFGFPRTVTAFGELETHWPLSDATADSGPRIPGPSTPEGTERAAGTALFDEIYGKNSSNVHTMLETFHPAFHSFVLESAYGRILSRPLLTPLDRELCAVAALAALDQIPQLVAHGRGALHFGATQGQLRSVLCIGFDGNREPPDAGALDELMTRIENRRPPSPQPRPEA